MSGKQSGYSFAAVVALLALRLVLGWHFFSEGLSHVTDPNWSSEGFLRAAKGPLATKYHEVLPDFYGLKRIERADATTDDLKQWQAGVLAAWKTWTENTIKQYKLDDKQEAAAEKVLATRTEQWNDWFADRGDELATYMHERKRLAAKQAEPIATEVPYQKTRIAQKKAELNGQARGWVGQLAKLDNEFKTDLRAIPTDEQAKRGPVFEEPSKLKQIDHNISWGLTIVGACLLVGFLTPVAAILAAAFLLSVVLSQPFWIPDTTATYYQWVEMLALVAIATTPVGRWGGLDFFLSSACGSCCKKKS